MDALDELYLENQRQISANNLLMKTILNNNDDLED